MAEPTKVGGGETRGPRGRGRRGRPAAEPELNIDAQTGEELTEKVVFINRSSKVVKGGRRFSFSALIVTGDKKGRVGVGMGKAGEVADAIRKGGEMSRAAMEKMALKQTTIPHAVTARFDGALVMLRPASPGTGIIAGKTVRAVLESAGLKDVLSKSLGSNNPTNVVKATLNALRQLRQREGIYKSRGLELKRVEPPPLAPVAPAAPAVAPAPPAEPGANPA